MSVKSESQNDSKKIALEPGWKHHLEPEFQKPYMKALKAFLVTEYDAGKTIYPKKSEIFAALNMTPFDNVKAVIVGQDPYHGPGQAHGLCFSVRHGVRVPPSLRNIFKELSEEIPFKIPTNGDLTPWTHQGVLLLNSILTVESGKAGSHQGKGWEQFTDKIIEIISKEKKGVTFILWGSFAQRKTHLIDAARHLVLKSAHPSPLSSHNGFFGNKHFIRKNGMGEINWQLAHQ